jgi:hypothetical protein
MLAEELMRFARRRFWPPASTDTAAACEAVTVLCRLATLHEDPEYQEAAVIAPDTDYAVDAEQLLQLLADSSEWPDATAFPEFGLALCDWLSLA